MYKIIVLFSILLFSSCIEQDAEEGPQLQPWIKSNCQAEAQFLGTTAKADGTPYFIDYGKTGPESWHLRTMYLIGGEWLEAYRCGKGARWRQPSDNFEFISGGYDIEDVAYYIEHVWNQKEAQGAPQ